ncbi:MAG: undecaprenyl-phosphate glucose phosphotransferase [Pseudomonadota bacterium]
MDSQRVSKKAVANGDGYRLSISLIPDLVGLLDVVLILLAALLPYALYVPHHMPLFENYAFCTLFIAVVSIFMLNRSGLYEIHAIMQPVAKSDLVIVSIVSAFLFFLTIAFSLKVSGLYSRVWIYSFAGSAVVFVLLGRIAMMQLLRRLSERRVVERNVVVFGAGNQAERFLKTVGETRPAFTRIAAVFSAHGEAQRQEVSGHSVTGTEHDIVDYVRSHRVDDIIIAMPWGVDGGLDATIAELKQLPVNVYVSSKLTDYQLQFKPALGHPRALPLFEVVQRPISGWSALLKSLEDYIITTALVILLAPLMLLIAIAIKIDSPGPVFFMQRRLGFNNREFKIYKFRSMYHRKRPERTVRQAAKGDPRITRVGRFIRRTSLDELPQLFNVLDGTMSLVGPRPHALSHNEDYGRQIRGYFARHRVKPGITGWAQVNNLRGETETLSKMEARVDYDIYYTENWSLLFDLRILLMTAVVVLFQKSAY